jgi:hypothetical protein
MHAINRTSKDFPRKYGHMSESIVSKLIAGLYSSYYDDGIGIGP